MASEIALIISSLGVGGLLGILTKSIIDKRQLKFSKVFDYKERRYQALTILMLTAASPDDYEMAQLKMRRPDIRDATELDSELKLEYYNAMLFASREVLKAFAAFLDNKSLSNYEAVAQAMKKDLYL
jgi:hypothetical protein